MYIHIYLYTYIYIGFPALLRFRICWPRSPAAQRAPGRWTFWHSHGDLTTVYSPSLVPSTQWRQHPHCAGQQWQARVFLSWRACQTILKLPCRLCDTNPSSLDHLISVSIYGKYSVGPSFRPICTRCCFAMMNMIQRCSNIHWARVFITNTRLDKISCHQGPGMRVHFRANRAQLKSFGFLRKARDQNLVLAVLDVPSLLDSGQRLGFQV